MPDLPTIGGGPGSSGSTASSSTGIGLLANASANTKATTWTELIASTSYPSNWIMIECQTASVQSLLFDIGVGASTAEQTLISNIYCHGTSSSPGGRHYLFPLRVPTGTRLSGRSQSSAGSGLATVAIQTISSPISAPPGMTRVETLGANTADSNGVSVDCGASANTDVVGELIASTAFNYKWMCIAVANPTDSTWGAATNFLFDVCVGAAGSEQAVVADLYVNGNTTDDRPSPSSFSFPCSIASGSRVSIRARCSVNTAGDRVLDFVGYGVG